MPKSNKSVTRTHTTMNDLPEEIIAQILEGIPKNEIPNCRTISKHLNSSITTWFGTTLSYSDVNRGSRLPQSLWQGHVTILKLKDYSSQNHRNLPPLPRLKLLEIEGKMRLQSLVRILGESSNLRDISIKFPNILDLDFDVTMAQYLPSRLETFQIKIGNQNHEHEIRVELSLFRILSQLPLSSLKDFSCIYVKENQVEEEEVDEMNQIRRESPDDLSSLIKTILTKCRRTLRVLMLSRSYDWLGEPKSPPIEREFKLKALTLLWVGESRWMRSLIDVQRARSGLETFIISCDEDLWVQGVVQDVSLASKASLQILLVQLFLKDGQILTDEFNLGFLAQFSKLEDFVITSERGFVENQGRRVLEGPLPPLVLPPTIKQVVLSAPITFQTLQAFCTLPALEEFTLKNFKWVDWPTLEAIFQGNGMAVDPIPSILLDWNWFKNLVINCPALKSINFIGCIFDITGILRNMIDVEGLNLEGGVGIHVISPIQNVALLGFTASVRIDRAELEFR